MVGSRGRWEDRKGLQTEGQTDGWMRASEDRRCRYPDRSLDTRAERQKQLCEKHQAGHGAVRCDPSTGRQGEN